MLPVDIEDVVFIGVDAYVIGNNPHYKTLSESARLRGWTVRRSFNSDYDNLLPLATRTGAADRDSARRSDRSTGRA